MDFSSFESYLVNLESEIQHSLPQDIGQVVVTNTVKRMATDRVQGPPLKPSTIANRRKRSGVRLVDTGHLMNSIRYYVKTSFGFFGGGGTRIIIGTPVKYGRFHQHGTRNIPQRKFLFLDDMDRRHIKAVLKGLFS